VECIPIPDKKELLMTAIDQFAAHVGLDWADKKHDVCVQFKNGERTFHVIEHTPEALDIWLTELHQKVKGRTEIANFVQSIITGGGQCFCSFTVAQFM
jgi:hypothetical protein